MDILTSLHGRRFGIGANGELIVNRPNGSQGLVNAEAYKQITSAQLLALNATPQAILPAPAAGLAYVIRRVAIYKPAGTAYAGIASGEDLVLKYTNGSGAQISSVIETTGFLDQATAQTRVAHQPGSTLTTAADYTPVAAAAVVLHLLTGEITTGTSPLHVRVLYDLIQTVFTS
jgi:uncharacterized membrane-anchored protein